jgi:hypothetical protein
MPRRNAAASFRRLLARPGTSSTVCLSGEAVGDSSLVHNQRGALRIGLDLAAQGMNERMQGLAITPGIGAPEHGEDIAVGRHPTSLPRKRRLYVFLMPRGRVLNGFLAPM